MKIFLDDVRTTPEGYVRCFWPEEVIELLQQHGGTVQELSLDHDLGDDEHGTGYDVLTWLEMAVACDGFTPPQTLVVHSANSAARARMEAAIAQIRVLHQQFDALSTINRPVKY
jgi:hypothetical protein